MSQPAIRWEWVAGATRPQKVRYYKDGRHESLAGADITLNVYDVETGTAEHTGLPVTIEADGGAEDLVYTPVAAGAEGHLPAGRYYARLKIVEAGSGVIDYLPADMATFEIVVRQGIEEPA